MNYRHQYDDAADEAAGLEAAIHCEDESLTIQDAPNSNINDILSTFGIHDGSQLPATLGITDPRYFGDFTNIPDLKTALDHVRDAEHKFNQLPAKLRSRFDNRPYKLYAFVNDPNNTEEAIQLGLLKKTAPEASLEPKKPDATTAPPANTPS